MGHTYSKTYSSFTWHLNFIRCILSGKSTFSGSIRDSPAGLLPGSLSQPRQGLSSHWVLPSTPQILPQSLSHCLLLPSSLQPPRHPLGKTPFLCPQAEPLSEGHNPSLGFATICLISGGGLQFLLQPQDLGLDVNNGTEHLSRGISFLRA